MQFEIKNRWSGAIQFTAEIEATEETPLRVKIGLAVRWAFKSGAVLSGAVLRGADLRGAVLRDADLRDADLSGAVLRGAVLRDADLRDADLSGAVLRDADLRGAVLRDADLRDADLSGAVLRGADLRDADLRGADLSGAVLRDADLSGAVLRDADLSGADLSGADLRGADLSGAVLRDADLRDADLSGAVLRDADLSGADLRSFKADFWMILTQNRAEVPALIAALCDGRVNGSTYTGDCACLMGTIANIRHCAVGSLELDSNRPAERWFMMIKKGDKPGDDTGGGFASRMAVTWALEWCGLNGIEAQPEWSAAVADKTSEIVAS